MNEVQVDEEKVWLGVDSFAVAFAHHVCVPDFLGQCLCHGHLPSLLLDCYGPLNQDGPGIRQPKHLHLRY
jgi:hypothetical protein